MNDNLCPICHTGQYMHAPDGRCDSCAEELGCECGCFPVVPHLTVLQALDPSAIRNGEGGYTLTVPKEVARGLPENVSLTTILISWALYDPDDPRLVEAARRMTAAFREDF